MTSALFSKKLKARKYDMRDDINSMKITETYVKLFKVRKNRGIADRKKNSKNIRSVYIILNGQTSFLLRLTSNLKSDDKSFSRI